MCKRGCWPVCRIVVHQVQDSTFSSTEESNLEEKIGTTLFLVFFCCKETLGMLQFGFWCSVVLLMYIVTVQLVVCLQCITFFSTVWHNALQGYTLDICQFVSTFQVTNIRYVRYERQEVEVHQRTKADWQRRQLVHTFLAQAFHMSSPAIKYKYNENSNTNIMIGTSLSHISTYQ